MLKLAQVTATLALTDVALTPANGFRITPDNSSPVQQLTCTQRGLATWCLSLKGRQNISHVYLLHLVWLDA
jgi:hypothetical protein